MDDQFPLKSLSILLDMQSNRIMAQKGSWLSEPKMAQKSIKLLPAAAAYSLTPLLYEIFGRSGMLRSDGNDPRKGKNAG